MAGTENVDPNFIIIQTEGYNPRTNAFIPCPPSMLETGGSKDNFCIGQQPAIIAPPPEAPPPPKTYYDWKGEKLCSYDFDMIKHCDLAANSLVHRTRERRIYSADKPMGENGMCSINPTTGQGCKVYIQGPGC